MFSTRTGGDDTSNSLDPLSLIVRYSNAPPAFVLNEDAIQNESVAIAAAYAADTSFAIVLGNGTKVSLQGLLANISAGDDECACEVRRLNFL